MKNKYYQIIIEQNFVFNGFNVKVKQSQRLADGGAKLYVTIGVEAGDDLRGKAAAFIEDEFRKSDLWKHVKEI